MHELSLAQTICQAVIPHQAEGHKIVAIVIENGPFSGVVTESLEYCFSIVAGEHGLSEAKLRVRNLQVAATCPACGGASEIDNMWAECDRCGHSPLTVDGGREFRIKEIEIEEVNHV